MPNRRAAERKAARIKVRFWAPGKPEEVSVGYTTNISTSGCFIQTERPVRTSHRLQLEFTTDSLGFVCEGIVARSIKSPFELRQVKPSGMGVHFFTIEELLRSMAPNLLDWEVSASKALEHKETAESPTPEAAESASEPQTEASIDVQSHSPAAQRAARNHPAAAPREKAPTAPETSASPVSAFRLAPASKHQLEKIYRSELVHGRLFIPTDTTYAQGSKVRIEIVLPGVRRTIELFATVTNNKPREDSSASAPGGLDLALQLPSSAVKAIGSFLTENS